MKCRDEWLLTPEWVIHTMQYAAYEYGYEIHMYMLHKNRVICFVCDCVCVFVLE